MSYLKKIFSQAGQESVRAILSLFEENSNAVLLDCGCGDGSFTQCVINKLKSREVVHGVEIDEECCKKAQARGIVIHKDDLNGGISLENKSVDVIFSNQVIEHLCDTDKFISEMYRVLKANGYAVICTENLSSWHNIFALILGWQPFSLTNVSSLKPSVGNLLGLNRGDKASIFAKGIPKFMQHTRVFAPSGLKEFFEIHSFKCEKIKGAGYYPLPGVLAKGMAKIDPRHSAFLILKARKTI